MSTLKKLAVVWLLPVLVAAAVRAPVAPAAPLPAVPADQVSEAVRITPLRPAPAPHAESPGLPALAGASLPDLVASGNATRAPGAQLRASAAAASSLARAHSRARSAQIRRASYAHRLRAVRGSVPVTSSQPPPSASI